MQDMTVIDIQTNTNTDLAKHLAESFASLRSISLELFHDDDGNCSTVHHFLVESIDGEISSSGRFHAVLGQLPDDLRPTPVPDDVWSTSADGD